MQQFFLQLLGAFQMTVDGVPIHAFRTNKARALLAYLAVERQPTSRDRLAGLLWPEWPEEAAHTYLRQALASLRATLAIGGPSFFFATRYEIAINPVADLQVDAVHLLQVLSTLPVSEKTKPPESPEQLARLEQVLTLYRGDFLQGFSLANCEAFQEWQLLTAEQIRRRVLDGLGYLADLCEQAGDYARARTHALQRVSLEPWLEEGQQQVIRLLARMGDPAAALAHYEQYRRRLAAELDILPDAATLALVEQIRRQVSVGTDQRRHDSTVDATIEEKLRLNPALPPPVFVARESELAALNEHLEAALVGQGRVVFVRGDAGQGKTLLIQAFARRAHGAHPEVLVLSGRCSSLAGVGEVLLPFREMLAQLTGDVAPAVAGGALTPDAAQVLWALMPETLETLLTQALHLIGSLVGEAALAARAVEAGGGPDLAARITAVGERNAQVAASGLGPPGRLFGEFQALLSAIAQRHPLLICLEDLHWADPDSLALLFHVGQRLAGLPILVLGTYRPEEVGQPVEGRLTLGRVLGELQRIYGEITLDLAQADGRAFVDAYIDAEPNRLDERFREALLRISGGHPLFTAELVGDLRARSSLKQDTEGCWFDATGVEWGRLPARLEAVIGRRIEHLPVASRRLLAAASVQGEVFLAEVAAEVLDWTPDDAARCLSEEAGRQQYLVQAEGVLQLGNRRARRYRFRHVLFQHYLAVTLDAVEKAEWHNKTADVLESLYRSTEDDIAEAARQLAYHHEEAGHFDKAIPYLVMAGKRALQVSAYQDAMQHFRRGLEQLHILRESSERDRLEAEMLAGLLSAMSTLEGHSASPLIPLLDRLQILAGRLDDISTFFFTTWNAWRYQHARGESDRAYELAQACLRMADRSGDLELQILVHEALGLSHGMRGDVRQASEHFSRGCALLVQNQRERQGCLLEEGSFVGLPACLGHILCFRGYLDQARVVRDEALARAQESENPSVKVFGFVLTALCYLYLRDYAPCRRYAEEAWSISTSHNMRQWEPMSQFYIGWVKYWQGDCENGLLQMRTAHEANGLMAPVQIANDAFLAEAYLDSGDLTEATTLLDTALMKAQRSGQRFPLPEVYRVRGELLCKLGLQDEAEAAFESAIAFARQRDIKLLELRCTVTLCRLWRNQGRIEAARERLAAIYGWFTEGFDTPDLVAARALLTELAASR